MGQHGVILATTDGGQTWTHQQSGTDERLNDVHFLDAQKGWAVGAQGTLLQTTDGGNKWAIIFENRTGNSYVSMWFPMHLQSLYVTKAGTGFAIGFPVFEAVPRKPTP